MLYRGMDRAQLDAAYNNLAAVPSSPKLFADWEARSACFREQHRGHLDLAYGAGSRSAASTILSRSALTISMRSLGSTRLRHSATARCSIFRRWQVRLS